MAPLSLKPTQKGVTMMAVAAGVIFICCLLACLGAVAKVREVDGERAKVEKQVHDSQTIAQTQRDSENRYLDTRAQIRFLESSVATQDYVPTLLKQIEHLGKSVHLNVIGVRPRENSSAKVKKKPAAAEGTQTASAGSAAPVAKAEPAAKPYDELSIDLQLEGNYMDALDFLYKLTSFPKIVAVNTVQMTPSSVTGSVGSPKLSIDINVTAFVLKEIPPAANQPAAATARATGRTGNEAG